MEEKLEVRRGELVKIIKSFESLEKSKEWETLKELVFSRSLASIERQMLNEATKKDVDINRIYYLQGEYAWARHYNDINHFIEGLTKELENINNKIK